jgi:anti-repressor protein
MSAQPAFPLVSTRQIGAESVQSVDARDLHAFLGVATGFKDWIARRITEYSFEEGQDFRSFLSESTGGRPSREYVLSIEMAKELAMVERTDKGKQARQYFIDCERQVKASPAPSIPDFSNPAIAARAWASEYEGRTAAESRVAELEPKAAYHDAMVSTVNARLVEVIAKEIGTGELRLFAWLRWVGRLTADSLPLQRYIDQGHFVVEQDHWIDKRGARHAYSRVLVTGKGCIAIQRDFSEEVAVQALRYEREIKRGRAPADILREMEADARIER